MQQTTHTDDGVAACDRLLALFEHALILEEQRCEASDDAVRAPLVRYVMAQIRMRVRPALAPGWLRHDPLHIALFGGTNSGKSTVVNICLGRVAAGMHVMARFSQHPEAYRTAALGDQWLEAYPSRFAGYARYDEAHPPRQSDQELAQQGYRPAVAVLDPEHGPARAITLPATTAAVFWDAPDFSTDVAQAYLGAVLDVAALADVVVMTVTDESYADDRGLALLRLVSASGVRLHIVANKLSNSCALLVDMQAKIAAHWHGATSLLPVEQWHPLPHVSGETPEQRLSTLLVRREAVALREAMAREAACRIARKRQALVGAVDFLERCLDDVLRPLAAEVEVATSWENTVTRLVHDEFLERYRSSYLHGQRYGEFNRTLVQVMELLEIPWVGPLIRRVSEVIRLPFRLVRGLLSSLSGALPVTTQRPPEYAVLTDLLNRCVAALKAEAQSLAATTSHPAWTTMVSSLDSRAWYAQMEQRFAVAYAVYRQDIDAAVQRRAASIYQAIAQRPWLLNALRGANLAVDAAAIALVVKSHGLDWSDAIVGPLVAGLRRALLAAGLDTYLVRQEDLLKHKQFEAVETFVSVHLVQPICNLFEGQVQPHELAAARHDLARVKAAVLQVLQEAKA